jgi:hypothetical protein
VHAHHHGRTGGGMGIKGCDLHTIPLCHSHHREWHQRARVEPFTTEGTKTEMWRGIAATLRLYVIHLQGSGSAEQSGTPQR